MLTGLFSEVLAMSVTGSAVICLILLLRFMLRRGPKWCVCLLWAAMLFRLLSPLPLEAPWSMDRRISSAELLVHNWQQTVMEDTVTLYSHTDAYAEGIREGRQPMIHKASGAFYLLAGEDDGQIPDTAEDVLFPGLAKIWLSGMAVFCLWNFLSWLRLRRKLMDAVCVDSHYWISDHISAPFVLGLICPKIYLPSDLDAVSQTMVLAHERSHIRRGDLWLKLLLLMALGIHWFNPMVWIGYWAAVQDMEAACDESALRGLGDGHRQDYAQVLLRMSAGGTRYDRAMVGFGAGAVKKRILRVLDGKHRSPVRAVVSFLLCILMLPVMVVDAAPPWPVRWIRQLSERDTRVTVILENKEYVEKDRSLRRKQRENLMGYLQMVEEDQISLYTKEPLIEGGTIEVVIGTERYHLSLGYAYQNGRACLCMTHCGGPENPYLIENVPLITYVEHLFSHYRCVPIHPSEVTPDMVLVESYQQGPGTYIYVYQTYCQTCQVYGTKYSVRGIGPILFGKKME